MTRRQDDAGTWTLIFVVICLAMFVGWLTDTSGQRWLAKFHEAREAAARSHVNSTENVDDLSWREGMP